MHADTTAARGRFTDDPSRAAFRTRRDAESTPHGRDTVPDRRRRLLPALDRAVVHRPPRRGRVRRPVGAVHPRSGRLLDRRGTDAMSALEVLLAVAGFAATALVVAGMILLTPRGEVELHENASDGQGSALR